MTPLVFAHEAMATEFQIFVAATDPTYAGQAAAAAWRELDRLEGELSRYVESSDIARANRLAAGEMIVIGDDTLQCLLQGAAVSEETARAFDFAYGCQRAPGQGAHDALFALDPLGHTLTSLCPRLQLDLGAIGKGYALDCMATVLREWSLDSAALQGGTSSLLALAPPPDAPGWVVTVAQTNVALAHRAIGGSGTAVQGWHLIDPHTGGPAARSARTWAFAATAAEADALSTAFFVMSDEEVRQYCAGHPDHGAVLANADGSLAWHGATARENRIGVDLAGGRRDDHASFPPPGERAAPASGARPDHEHPRPDRPRKQPG